MESIEDRVRRSSGPDLIEKHGHSFEEHGHSFEKREAEDLDEEERQIEALIEEVNSKI